MIKIKTLNIDISIHRRAVKELIEYSCLLKIQLINLCMEFYFFVVVKSCLYAFLFQIDCNDNIKSTRNINC